MWMTEYETTVVVRPDITGDVVETTLDRVRDAVKKSGGKLLALNHWGKKKLAYPIQKHGRGIYVHAQYVGPNDLVAELERNLRNSENVLRFMSVKVAEHVNPADREEKPYTRPHYESYDAVVAEEEAAARREEQRAMAGYGRGGWGDRDRDRDREPRREGGVEDEAADVEVEGSAE